MCRSHDSSRMVFAVNIYSCWYDYHSDQQIRIVSLLYGHVCLLLRPYLMKSTKDGKL